MIWSPRRSGKSAWVLGQMMMATLQHHEETGERQCTITLAGLKGNRKFLGRVFSDGRIKVTELKPLA